jgi:hypothetical protein
MPIATAASPYQCAPARQSTGATISGGWVVSASDGRPTRGVRWPGPAGPLGLRDRWGLWGRWGCGAGRTERRRSRGEFDGSLYSASLLSGGICPFCGFRGALAKRSMVPSLRAGCHGPGNLLAGTTGNMNSMRAQSSFGITRCDCCPFSVDPSRLGRTCGARRRPTRRPAGEFIIASRPFAAHQVSSTLVVNARHSCRGGRHRVDGRCLSGNP